MIDAAIHSLKFRCRYRNGGGGERSVRDTTWPTTREQYERQVTTISVYVTHQEPVVYFGGVYNYMHVHVYTNVEYHTF